MKYIILLVSVFVIGACSHSTEQKEQGVAKEPVPEAYSFSGKPLYAKPTDSVALAKADSTIKAIHSKKSLTEEDYIEIGRQLTGTNRFRLTVENYSEGLKQFPASFKLLRHRGHRYLNLRQLDNAIKDLAKAEELIRKEPTIWEYDALGKPTATYQHQVWYHIGLYHFLKRDYAASATAYEKSLAATKEGKNIAGASDWLYNAYQRSGQQAKIAALLKPFTLDFEIEDKDYPYYRRLLLFSGAITPEQLVDADKPIEQMSLGETTKLYGLANWYRYKGDSTKANDLYKKVLLSKEWAGFAYACSELDVKK